MVGGGFRFLSSLHDDDHDHDHDNAMWIDITTLNRCTFCYEIEAHYGIATAITCHVVAVLPYICSFAEAVALASAKWGGLPMQCGIAFAVFATFGVCYCCTGKPKHCNISSICCSMQCACLSTC